MHLQLIVICILILLSAFFSGTETAYTSLSLLQIHDLETNKGKRGKLVKKLHSRQDILLTTILICNNLVNIGASALATSVTIELFGSRAIGAMTGILTFIILVVGEVTPKQLAIIHNEGLSLVSAPIIYGLSIVLRPVIYIISGFSKLITKFFKKEKKSRISLDRIIQLVRLGENLGIVEQYETQLVRNVFRFNDVTIDAIMTHRTEVFSLQESKKVQDILKIVTAQGFSRIPVYKKHPEEITGIILLKDILQQVAQGAETKRLRDFMHPPIFVSPSKRVNEMFTKFQEEKLNIAVVLDEYGGLAGIVTIEDLVEELVGELYDENEKKETEKIIPVGDRSYKLSGDITLEHLNDALGIKIPKGKYSKTLAGFLANAAGKIPEEKEKIPTPFGEFFIERTERNRILSVLFTRKHKI